MKLLEKHFEIALETPEGITRLRELILKLGIQGKLVTQDHKDESGIILIEKIRIEKQKLIDKGLIKKQKELEKVADEEMLYTLPKGWVFERLNNVIDVRDGTHNSPKDATGINTFPLITSKNFINGIIDFDSARRISEEDHIEISKRSNVEKDDILFSMIGGNLGNQVIVSDNRQFSIKNVALLKFYNKDLTIPFFIKKYTEYLALDIQMKAKGGAQPFVGLGELRNLIIGLPPVEEQKRIVEKINQLILLCDKLEAERNRKNKLQLQINSAAINNLIKANDEITFNNAWSFIANQFDTLYAVKQNVTDLKEVILNLAMRGKLVSQDNHEQSAIELHKEILIEKSNLIKSGSIRKQKELPAVKKDEITYELPKNWKWVRLNDFGTWKSGSTPNRSNSSFYEGNIPWVKSGEVKQGKIKFTTETITDYALEKCSLHINPIGSVLIAMYGANIGEAGILEIEAATNQAVCACNTFAGIDNNFLYNVILSLKNNFISQGAGAAQPNISREKIINTVVPLPPYEEQKRIVNKINQLFELCETLEKKIEQSSKKQSQILNAVLAQI
ncbi:EcoKI restriction-modification system protein HsdS [Chryseobacterium nakagawai]|uniref:Restriction endonuclease subunit S n=1 Tax=Chryseobacterium nakagawai TaxID=1241982 RepID=A0AAD0YL51_CHRNA|nr:restriction endonuclease subunit S [Chryseobacterium nakagawai]AZA89843.1 restriction endonuclease subunit S [Chryseobacterium nakagawai]VEH21248.1 EcoKI restriction-modification system protein HsdS [Chryseobacterium nakagawai]